MTAGEMILPPHHQRVADRFAAACLADPRVVAAFLGGSYATGKADAWSDLDLYLITSDEGYDEFVNEKESFIRQLGEPLFLEDWGAPHGWFYILANGCEGELWIGRTGRFKHLHGGAYEVLVDKQGILDGVIFPLHRADPSEQQATLRRLIMDFWHEMGHFTKALAREQLWFAYGSLEELRGICVNLARLRHNFRDPDVGDEPYWKIEQAMPVEQLAQLRSTFCSLEQEALQLARQTVLQFYREVATSLAETHGLDYPAELDRLLAGRR
jgi:hypothetical protein